jgi:hypothetical protein
MRLFQSSVRYPLSRAIRSIHHVGVLHSMQIDYLEVAWQIRVFLCCGDPFHSRDTCIVLILRDRPALVSRIRHSVWSPHLLLFEALLQALDLVDDVCSARLAGLISRVGSREATSVGSRLVPPQLEVYLPQVNGGVLEAILQGSVHSIVSVYRLLLIRRQLLSAELTVLAVEVIDLRFERTHEGLTGLLVESAELVAA